MNRNLGANVNSNGEADEEKILHSYGMYYQWGRKDPLVGAASYDFSGNTDARMYNSAGRRIYLQYTASDASTGTVEYAVAHPDAMITGAENNGFDWLYSQHDDTLWPETGAKSDYDPCPAGWRVAAGDIFAALTISPEDDGMDWMQAKRCTAGTSKIPLRAKPISLQPAVAATTSTADLTTSTPIPTVLCRGPATTGLATFRATMLGACSST